MWKTVLPFILVFSVNVNFTFADDSLEAREIEWLTSLREQIPQVSVSQQHISIAYLVAVLVETGRFQEARTIALNQPDAERRYSRLADISVALAKVSRFDEALETIDEISNLHWKERATYFIALELASQGNLSQAESLLSEMPDGNRRDSVVAEICKFLAQNGEFDQALARATEIKGEHQKGETTEFIHNLRDGKSKPIDQLTGSLRDRVSTLIAFSSDGAYDAVISAIVAAQAGDREQALKLVEQSIRDANTPDFPPKKLTTAILACVVYVEIDDLKAAGDMATKLYAASDNDWSGLSTAFGNPILMSLLVRLERFDAIDEILARKRENYRSDPSESSYLFTTESLAEALVEYGRLDEFERRRTELQSADEKLYLLMGAIIGADYSRQTGR